MRLLMDTPLYEKDFMICHCMKITVGRLEEEYTKGATTLPDLRRATGVCSFCRVCADKIIALLEYWKAEGKNP